MLFLRKNDIIELTGYKRRYEQMRWLRDNDFLFRVGADGTPRVLIEEVMGNMVNGKKRRTRRLSEN